MPLSREKLARLRDLLQADGLAAAPPSEIQPARGDEPRPLSFAQQRLWFLEQLEPGRAAYNIPVALRLRGALAIPHLVSAIAGVLDRHEALRTTFHLAPAGEPTQVVQPVRVPLAIIDLTAIEERARQRHTTRLLREEAARPYDLAAGPLVRWTLLQLEPAVTIAAITLHHIVSDAWSTDILVRELTTLYDAHVRGVTAELTPLPIQYADFAAWQRREVDEDTLREQRAYWQRRLAAAPSVLPLPLDRPRPATMSERGASHAFTLSPELTHAVRERSHQARATPFMLLLAAWQALLSRHGAGDDVVVGTPIAGRTRVETEPLIGFFVNTLAIRTDLRGRPTFADLLRRVRDGMIEAQAHQDLPFERLVDELAVERSLAHTPIVQVLFNFLTESPLERGLQLQGVAVDALDTDSGTTKFDLKLGCRDNGDRIAGALTYRTELFDPITIARMAAHLLRLLEQVVADPERRPADVPLLAADERYLLERWNAPGAALQAHTIPELFARQVERTPDAPAVEFAGQTLTYADLHARAARAARHLRAIGVRPDAIVAISGARSLELPVVLLAVLTAGGAYLPLDPTAPSARLRDMLEDAQVDLLIADATVAVDVRDALTARGGTVLRLDALAQIDDASDSLPLFEPLLPAHLAYAIYTSGTTGRPKAVLISHDAICRLIAVQSAWPGFGPGERVLQLAPLSFDASVAEIFTALCSGSCLSLAPAERLLSGDDFVQILAERRITNAKFTPSGLSTLPVAALPDLATIIVGGEACPTELVARWGGERRLLNVYGPTEATVRAAAAVCTPGDVIPPIGRPIANARLYVLDAHGGLAPIGVAGELYIGGDTLARGYLRRPGLTADRFVPSPFDTEPGARLYRTGDRVRWRNDGQLMFLGRTDTQVKLRGFRVELGEIESLLATHPAVSEAVVIVRRDDDLVRLVAYVVSRDGAEVPPAALRQHLAERLPDYMVPALFVALRALPQTRHGKVDREALPAPVRQLRRGAIAPRTPTEDTLAAIWRELLRLPQIGVEDNFFALGGDSILSIQIVARARQAGIVITPRQLFEHQTVAALAGVAAPLTARRDRDEQGLVQGAVTLTQIQRRFLESAPPAPHHWNMSVLFAAREPLALASLEASVARVVAHHDSLRLRFWRDSSRAWQQENLGLDTRRRTSQVDLDALDPAAQRRLLEQEAARLQASLSLETGQVLRVISFTMTGSSRLLVVVHHLVIDAVSWRVLLEDLQRAWRQMALPAKTTSYRAWAAGLAAQAEAGAFDGELAYWCDASRQDVRPLPIDHPGGANTYADARSVAVQLDEEQTRQLLQAVPSVYRTQINDVLLTALARVLGRWSGEARVLVDVEGHGREEAHVPDVDLSRTVGWFTTIYPVVLDLRDCADAGSALKAVKEQLRRVPSQGLGYGALRDLSPESSVRERLANARAAQVRFEYFGQLDSSLGGEESVLTLAEESPGRETDARTDRGPALVVSGAVLGGRLRVTWRYSAKLHERRTIARLAQAYVDDLQALIAHCASPEAGGRSSSDFPLAHLSQGEVDRVVGRGDDVEDLYPLSPLQEGLLFHLLYEPERPTYVGQFVFMVEGALDVAAFESAWQAVIDRHGVLRTAFVWGEVASPLQVVRRRVSVPLRVEDWRAAGAAREPRLTAYLEADRQQGFAPERAPLMRLSLLREGPTRWALVWTHHHLLLDGWSVALIAQEVAARYASAVAGETMAPLRVRPYRDYIAWLQRQDLDRAETFWRTTLADVAPAPIAIRREAGGTAGRLQHRLDAAASAALQAAARRQQVTPHTLVEAAWALVLSRWSGTRDVLFGVTVSGRPPELAGVEQMVGLFINTLPRRVRVPDGEPVGAWMQTLQAEQVALREYEYSPLAQVQRWSGVPPGTPLFESLLVFANYPTQELPLSASAGALLQIIPHTVHETTMYPLTLGVSAGAEAVLQLEYTGEIGEATALRLLTQLERALSSVASPDAIVGRIDLDDEAERQMVVEGWSGQGSAARAPAQAVDASAANVPALIAAQAARTPTAAAVIHPDGVLTYAALDEQATALAAHLQSLGVGAETLVAIRLPRSAAFIVAMVGVLRSGGAYLPVDPALPAARQATLLEEAQARIVIGLAETLVDGVVSVTLTPAGVLVSPRSASAISMTDESGRAQQPSMDPVGTPPPAGPVRAIGATAAIKPTAAIAPAQLAYVIYTSGSTGRPKGVAVSHASLAQFAPTLAAWLGLAPGDRVLQFAAPGFDVLLEEVVPALMAGAAVVVADVDALTPAALSDLLEATGVTVLELPTAFCEAWVAALATGEARRPAALRCVLMGGERVRGEAFSAWPAVDCELGHVFGLTETTVTNLIHRVPAGAAVAVPVPLGPPLPGARVYVLDAAGRPVPVGVAGELAIGGAGVARGYLGQPARTAARFVPDPFDAAAASGAGGRLYLTGDQVRWENDGTLTFLGRTDTQVKVRGFRIELGEIEHLLRTHPAVSAAAVLLRADAGVSPRLVAYVVGHDTEAPPIGALETWLRAQLPAYMVPAAYVALPALPLTRHGKVNRAALPAPTRQTSSVGTPPRTPTEQTLAAIWRDVLRVPQVLADDNFFALGGDSILSLQIVARARQAGLAVTPRQIFEQQTIAELARVALLPASSAADDSGPVQGPVPLTPIQHRFVESAPPAPHHWNMSVLFAAREPIVFAALEPAVSQMVAHHDALRLRFWRDANGTWQQENRGLGGSARSIQVDLSALDEETGTRVLEREAGRLQASLSLESGQLLRVALFTFSSTPARSRLLVVVHHLVMDGVSWRLLLEDLQQAYAQRLRGESVSLPAKTTSFRTWSTRLAAQVAAGAFDGEVAYWTAAARQEVRPLPVDHPDGANLVTHGRSVTMALDPETTRQLLHAVPPVYRTQINDLLLTALARVLGRWSGDARVLVDVEGHGREDAFVPGADLSRTVGWFTTIYPVLFDLRESADAGTALKTVKEQLRAVPSRGLGYGALRYLSQDAAVRARLASLPAAPLRFEYLGQLDQALDGGAALFTLAPECAGPDVDPRTTRDHALVVNAVNLEGRLQVSWQYSAEQYARPTIEQLAHGYIDELRTIVAHCLSSDAGGRTPSDFPLARLSQAQIDRLVGRGDTVEDVYALSPMQEGMLFHTLYAPGTGMYVVQFGFTLEGALDEAALREAWTMVIARHAALRTRYVWADGADPVQIVLRHVDLPLTSVNWRALSEDDRAARLERALTDDRLRGFDLGAAPLLRLALYRTGERMHRLVLTLHMMVLDGWSVPILFRDVVAHYDAAVAGRDAALAVPRPFRHYIAWLQQQDLRRAEAYWRHTLSGAKPTRLIVERTDPAEADTGYGRHERRFGAAATAAVQAFARAQQRTVNTLVQAAWALLLSRYTGEADVLFGVTVAGRPPDLAGAEEMVGLFINTLPLRVTVAEAAIVGPWLQQLQAQLLHLQEYDYSPLAQVQRWSDVPAGTPLFDSILAFNNYPAVDPVVGDELRDLRITGHIEHDLTSYPLTLSITLDEHDLCVRASYARDRFDDDIIDQILRHFQRLLEWLTVSDTRPLAEAELLAREDRTPVLATWNATSADWGDDYAAIQERFEGQAARTPTAVAVVAEDRSWTYAEIDAQANALAWRLRAAGVGPDVCVALCLSRSVALCIAVLGVLKAGGAYVPLDPGYPRDRLRFMLDDARARLLVSDAPELAETLAGEGDVPILLLERSPAPVATEDAAPPPPIRMPADALAYVIYTSGSTGRPKGVAMTRRALANLLSCLRRDWPDARPPATLQFTSLAFDASFLEFFTTWELGGHLVLIGEEARRDPHRLLTRIDEAGVTRIFLPFVALQHLAEAAVARGRVPRSIRELVTAGEALQITPALREWFTQSPACILDNEYGPSETHVVTVERLTGDAEAWPALPSIGSPVANTQVYVLDRGGRPVRVGVNGELFIGGFSLARGYLARPALTADRFVPDPFGDSTGGRLYRTGDQVRWRADGTLTFLGRLDGQAKIRGYRIEPGEVESAIAAFPGVRDVAVVVREVGVGDRRLAAYVVPAAGVTLDASALKSHLRERLPDYMVPASLTMLDEFPLTLTGKVDRKALPAPDRLEAARGYVAPRTATEALLAQIWTELLSRERVGVDENFLELGGHSLIAMRLLSRVRQAFGVEIPLQTLFEAQTIASLAGEVDAAVRGGVTTKAPPIVPVASNAALPLSFTQQRLWFLAQLEPRSTAYNIPVALRLRGAVDAPALAGALSDVVQRHEVLRTTYGVTTAGDATQVILPFAPVPLPVVDLSALAADAREARLARLIRAEAARPFDLARGPVLRSTLVRLAPGDAAALFTIHHIASDLWSTDLLVREVTAGYRARTEGTISPLPALAVQYADYAVWQRQWLQGDELETQLAYWRARLAGAPAVLELPLDRPRSADAAPHGGHVPVTFTPALAQALNVLSQLAGATLYMTLLAAWQLVLARYGGHEALVVGTPVAGRTRLETEPLIGFFVNMLPIRADVSGGLSFRDLLRQVRAGVLEAQAHQEVPFERLVEELTAERSLTHSPLFQVTFTLNNVDVGRLQLGDTQIESMPLETATVQFDLNLTVDDVGSGALTATLTYNAAIFDRDTIAQLARHFVRLLHIVSDRPDVRVGELELLDAAERSQMLARGHGPVEGEVATTMPALFRAQVERTPQAAAVVHAGGVLTYAALDARAAVLAARLQQAGVGPDVVVALGLERSVASIVGMLGAMQAGGAYLPLDPAYPAERLTLMLADARARVLVTGPAWRASHAERVVWDGPVIAVSAEGTLFDPTESGLRRDIPMEASSDAPSAPVWPAGSGALSPMPALQPGHLAYVIFTSGSTGRPKGVAVSHESAASYSQAFAREMGLASGDRMLQFASPGFDVAVEEVLPPLVSGAAVVVCEDDLLEPSALQAALSRFAISVVELPTAYWHEWVRHLAAAGARPPASLRRVLMGGERVLPARLQAWAAMDCGLTHVFGLTETTVTTTLHHLAAGEGGTAAETLPLGAPLTDMQLVVLDPALRLVPLKVPGELYIGGVGVARGYLGQPALTASRFIPHPFGPPGARLYRTGDLVRWRRDGELEFLGRLDRQVKLRGYRIEPGEIEAVLAEHPAIGEVVVTVRSDTGEPRLVAYVVARDREAELPVGALQAHMQARLPAYQVPATFVRLDKLPVTAHGKIDHGALPAPGESQRSSGYEAPRTVLEEMLTAIWADVLGLERVGIDDNFFELGGHSLVAIRLISRVRESSSVELPLRALFEAQTVRTLTARVEALRAEGTPIAPPIVPVPRVTMLPLSFAQQRLWFLAQLEPESAAYNIPVALRLLGAFDRAALAQALSEVVRRHEVLRTTYRMTASGEAVQVIHAAAPVVLPVVDLSALDSAAREAHVMRLVRAEAARPFDLVRGPVLRTTLLRLGDEEAVALFTVHHIASDMWSTDLLVREVTAGYRAGHAVAATPLPVQYADYAVWQRKWLQGDVLDAQLAYWRTRLEGAPAVLDLPLDRPRSAGASRRSATHHFTLSRAMGEQLRDLSRREGVTPFMTALAVWQLLLSRYSGQHDIVVGTPVAGRTRLETEPLIGFFVNTLVIRTSLDDNPTFRELLARVREGVLEAQDHQDVPFERLVDALSVERSLIHSPLFQVLFNLVQAQRSDEELRLGSTVIEGIATTSPTAKFDLNLSLHVGEAGVTGTLEFRTGFFDQGTIARMTAHLVQLLEQVLTHPERQLSEVDLLTDAERRQLDAWNAPARVFPARTIPELFVEQVTRTPHAPAAEYGGQTLTYGELLARVERAARRLRTMGVGPETIVAVCLDRSLDLPVALLAIMAAGGAYLPLDPALPAERLRDMLEDAQVRLVLTNGLLSSEAGRAFEETGGTVLQIDRFGADDLADTRATDAEAMPVAITPAHAAYIIYTSGTTGRPKGVVVPHGAVTRLFPAQAEQHGFGPGERVLPLAPLSFDASVAEIFTTLCAGACLCLPPAGTVLPGAEVVQQLADRRITNVKFTPSGLAALPMAPLPDLATILVGGELCPGELVARWGHGRRFFHVYGPTEGSIRVTSWECTPGELAPPIGRGFGNARLYVLDDSGRLAPIGAVGELYLGGDRLARGYLRRASLTADRFVPSPFDPEPGARLYRTGDRVRWRGDGQILFLGRRDTQVKLRGIRIELGEIESHLARHPAIREAVVIIDGDGDQKRLVAYVVSLDDASINAAELRPYLLKQLPKYMVPAIFMVLPSLPQTRHGKVDRRALPAPERPARVVIAPRTAPEERLAEIWRAVLRLEEIGVDENFFELGGDSILSLQIVARARQAGLVITPRQIFEQPTIAELASVAALEAQPRAAEQGLVQGPVVLTPIQRRFVESHRPSPHHWNMSMLFSVRERLRFAALEQAVAQVVAHHDALRLRVERTPDGTWRQENLGLDAWQRSAQVDLEALDEPVRRRLLEREAARLQGSLSLERGQLLRVVLFTLSTRPASSRLLIVVHHLVTDGVSWRVLLEDLQQAYTQIAQGAPAALPAKTTSFQAWAAGLAAQVEAGAFDGELPYWQAAARQELRSLPIDRPGGANGYASARSVGAELDEEETRQLLQEVPQAYRTRIDDVLLTALARVVGRWSGDARLLVEVEGHGREEAHVPDADLSRTVGWFTTIYPVLLDLRECGDEGAALKAVKEQLRGVPSRGLGHGVLRHLSPDPAVRERLASQPAAPVRFEYLGQFDQSVGEESLFAVAPESSGPMMDLRGTRPQLLTVNSAVYRGRLDVSWQYSTALHARETVEALARDYVDELRRLIAHCTAEHAGGHTPSDFPLANIDAATLSAIEEQVIASES